MVDPATAIGVGGAIYGAITGGRREKRARAQRRAAIAQLRAAKPQGYITPEDITARNLSVGRIAGDVRARGETAGAGIGNRMRQRGLAGSPSEERSRSRLESQVLQGVERAGESGEEQLYNTRLGRETFEQNKELSIFGAQMGDAEREKQRSQAEQGAYWNSLSEFMPAILGGIDAPAMPTNSLRAASNYTPPLPAPRGRTASALPNI